MNISYYHFLKITGLHQNRSKIVAFFFTGILCAEKLKIPYDPFKFKPGDLHTKHYFLASLLLDLKRLGWFDGLFSLAYFRSFHSPLQHLTVWGFFPYIQINN